MGEEIVTPASIQGGILTNTSSDLKAEKKKKKTVLSQEGIRTQVYIKYKKARKFLGLWPSYIVHKCSSGKSVIAYF